LRSLLASPLKALPAFTLEALAATGTGNNTFGLTCLSRAAVAESVPDIVGKIT
jgi:hypothetical protein